MRTKCADGEEEENNLIGIKSEIEHFVPLGIQSFGGNGCLLLEESIDVDFDIPVQDVTKIH